MTIWDGWPDQPEDEIEQAWQDPLDGEVPGQPPHTVEDTEPWSYPEWPDPKAHLDWKGFYEDDEEGP